MSGGSFNYLCDRDWNELIGREETLALMRDALVAAGAYDAAAETEDLIATIRQTFVRIETRRRRLASVWQAMEWWKSGDWGPEQFAEALAKYRSGDPP